MADESTQETGATDGTSVPEGLQFDKPDKSKHVYNSVNPEGYTMKVNGDRKTWSASGPSGILGASYRNRAEAQAAIMAAINPEQAAVVAAAEAAKPKSNLSAREAAVLGSLKSSEGAQTIEQLVALSGLDAAQTMGVVSILSRRRLLQLSGDGSTITELGDTALANYIPKVKVPPTFRIHKNRDVSLEAKFGPRPEGIEPRPTVLEYEQCRLANTQSSLEFALMDQRVHPYSPIAKKKVDNARERLRLAEIRLGEASKQASAGEGQAPALSEGS